VDMVKAVRSPGSTLKPLLYGLALDDGLIHAESLLQDVPRRFGDYRPGNFDTGFHGAVSTSEALIRSLNLPAVQVLDAYGPKRFVGDLRNVGVDLRFAEGSEPSLAVILGGTGSRLDQLVQAYSVFARGGKVAQLRFTPTDPLVERKLMSPGAAWIIRRILGGQELPQPDDVLPANVPLAWKTGTSYGYRDAWAIGLNPHYLIGVWVGRPDGTPVAGQYGFASAVPLLNQVNNLLLSSSRYSGRVNAPDPRPDSVSIRRICWPGGQPLAEGDSNCRQSRLSWILDGTIPPTLSAEGQEVNTGSMMTLWVNSQGKRVAPDCPDAQRKVIALWPTPLEPWLSPQERRAVRLPAADSRCPPLNKDQALPLLLLGIRDNAVLNRLPGEKSIDLTLHSQGGSGQRWWFLNGVQVPVSAPGVDFHYKLTQPGNYQLTVLDESSQVTTLNFTLQ
jgi:penicillin-binding protein 1C